LGWWRVVSGHRENYGGTDFGAFVPGEYHIELATGRYLDLADPRAEVITVGAVAHGLSHTCRFAGQSERFYSVAEHACLVAARLESAGAPDRVVYAGLHHDDSEAFIGELLRPQTILSLCMESGRGR
jgi:hypothetical protein